MMNKLKMAIILGWTVCHPGLVKADQMQNRAGGPSMSMMDCSSMSPEMSQFASQLQPGHKAMFCGKFNDPQRATAMQLASQQDASGKPMMTPDEAVHKVAMDNHLMMPSTQKTPTGCPVK